MQGSASRGTPIGAVIVIVGGALLAVGSFLTWLSLSGEGVQAESVTGMDGSDGWFTLIAGAVAVIAGVLLITQGRRALAILAVIAGLVGAGVGLYDALTVRDQIAGDIAEEAGVPKDEVRAALDQSIDSGLIELSMGVGLYLVIGGGVLAIVGGVMSLGGRKPEMPAREDSAVSTQAPAMPPSTVPQASASEPGPPPPAPPAPPPAP